MHGNLGDDEFRATRSDAPPCSDATGAGLNCTDLQGPYWFGLLCRHLSPSKPWLWLMEVCGFKERTAHNYVAGHSIPEATSFLVIVRSPFGYRALAFVLQFNPPDWWLEIQDALAIKRAIEGVKRCSTNGP